MEFQLVAHVPEGCTLCRATLGPFLKTHLDGLTIVTGNGAQEVAGNVAICVGPDETHPGCAVMIGRASDRMVDKEQYVAAMNGQVELAGRIEALQQQLDQARTEQVKVVPVDEVLDLIQPKQ